MLCQIFYGASDLVLDREDVQYPIEVDAEIIGTGAATAFVIITPMILLAYAIEGRKAIQATKMDAIFCFIAAATLIASGGWSSNKSLSICKPYFVRFRNVLLRMEQCQCNQH